MAAPFKPLELMRKLAFAIAAPLTVIMLSIHVWSAYDTYTGLKARAVSATAVISEIAQGRGGRNVTIYSFVSRDGTRATGSFSMQSPDADHLRVGQPVRVVYDPSMPSRNAPSVDSAWLSLRNGVFLWFAISPLFIALVYFATATSSRRAR